MKNLLTFLIIVVVILIIARKIIRKLEEPRTNKGSYLRFKACLSGKPSEATDIALTFDEPYRTRMLKQIWKEIRYSDSSDLVAWLERLPSDLRESIFPGKHLKLKIKTIKEALDKGVCRWVWVEETGYELSRSELEKLAKKGDKRAIAMLDS